MMCLARMMAMQRYIQLILLAVGVFAMPKYSMAFDLVPHHAVYDIDLVRVLPTLPLTGIQGTVEFNIFRTCDDWRTEYKNVAELHYRDQPLSKIELSHISHEDFVNKSINYARQEYKNDQLDSFERGHAHIKGDALHISNNVHGDPINTKVKGAYMFPIAHTIEVLKQIENNVQSQSYYVFDGVENNAGHAFHQIVVTIGNKNNGVDGGLWPVHFAYYDVGQDGMVPTHEMELTMRENGIIDRMEFVYSDFTVRQTLKHVKELEHHECD